MVVLEYDPADPSVSDETPDDSLQGDGEVPSSGSPPTDIPPDRSLGSGPSPEHSQLPTGQNRLEPEALTLQFQNIKDILQGRSKWGEFLKNKPHFREVLIAIQISYKYHPENDGKNPRWPVAKLGDIQVMREDLMHLSALNVRLAAIGAMFESSVEAIDQERRLARSRAWRRIRASHAAGERGSLRMTNEALEHEANTMTSDYYQTESELMLAGKILAWVRQSVRDMAQTLQVLIRSAFREEEADAKFH
jgi:hypothetical protein